MNFLLLSSCIVASSIYVSLADEIFSPQTGGLLQNALFRGALQRSPLAAIFNTPFGGAVSIKTPSNEDTRVKNVRNRGPFALRANAQPTRLSQDDTRTPFGGAVSIKAPANEDTSGSNVNQDDSLRFEPFPFPNGINSDTGDIISQTLEQIQAAAAEVGLVSHALHEQIEVALINQLQTLADFFRKTADVLTLHHKLHSK